MAPDVTVIDGMSTATQLACPSSNEQPDASVKDGEDDRTLASVHKTCQASVAVSNEQPELDTPMDEQISGMDKKPKVDVVVDGDTEKSLASLQ